MTTAITTMSNMKAILSTLNKLPVPCNSYELNALKTGPKVLVNAFPKAGTNLLLRVVSLLPTLVPRWQEHLTNNTPNLLQEVSAIRKGQYLSGHVHWSPELSNVLNSKNIRSLLIIRDLRDIAVSNFYYITYKSPDHRLHSYFNSLNSDEERLMASIVGVDGKFLEDGIRSKSIGEHARDYAPWFNESTCLVVRFEELIGSGGGGSDDQQLNTVSAITNHLGIELSEEQIAQIASQAFFKNSTTFRKGEIGDWRNHFNEPLYQAFNEVAGEVLVKFGYTD